MKNRTTIIVALALCLCANWLFGQGNDKLTIAKEVDSLTMEAQKTAQLGNFDDAVSMLDMADKLALAHFGDQSQEYAACLFRRGSVLVLSNRYPEAIKLLERAEALFAQAAEPMTKNRSSCSNFLGSSYSNVGNLAAAETAYYRALNIGKQVFGEKTPQVTRIKSNISNLLIDMDRNDEAILLTKEILAVKEEIVGKMSRDYAMTLNQLGIIYARIGTYEEAEPILLEACQILEKTVGSYHVDYASPISNLAVICSDTRRFAEAENHYLKVKVIYEKSLSPDHPYVAEINNNLGTLYMKQLRYEEASEYFSQSLTVRAKSLGENNMKYVGTQLNLGIVYLETGRLKAAEELILSAKNFFEKNQNVHQLLYAEVRVIEANLYMEMERYEEAGQAYQEAIRVFEQNNATQHPNFQILLDRYAKWQLRSKLTDAGIATQKRLLKSLEGTVSTAATYMSEQELATYSRTLAEAGDMAFSCLSALPEHRQSLAQVCYDNALFKKGFLQNAVGQVRRLANQNAETVEQFHRLTGYRRQLAAQYSLPNAERDSAKVAQLEADAQDMEKQLVLHVAGYGELVKQVEWRQVQAALAPGEAAIEFVSYKMVYPEKTEAVQYAALVLRPGQAQPAFVPLCEEKQLNDLLRKRKSRRSDYVNDLYSSESTQLNDLIWKNIEPSLQGVKTIYHSPAGLLFRFNLAAIPIAGNSAETLSDRYHFVQLGSTRQLAIKAAPQALADKSALVYGGISYEPSNEAVPIDTSATNFLASRSRGELDFSATDSTLRGSSWSYLGWTEKEAEAVRSSLSASGFRILLQSGLQATEEQFKSMGDPEKMTVSPQVIHLATHGYFFPDPTPQGAGNGSPSGAGGSEPVFKTSDQPMIRSGLILAGGNHAWKTGKPLRPDMEDGILTAYEISQMDLSGTELVVLSACETGLGDIDGNEGVYGLQRAFKIAGAKYLVMSLWQVPDQQTQELMAAFYENWLTKEMSIPDAFRAAQQTVRERYEHPFFWAGFVLVE